MKKLMIAAAAMAALTFGAQAADTIRIASEGAYAPFNYVDDNGKLAGYEIELGNLLCEKAGLTCEFVQNEWDSMIPNLLAGNYDAIMAGMSITEERLQTISFSDDYYPPESSLFVVPTGGTVNFDELKGYKIGVQGGTIQAAYAEDNFGADNTILSYTTADQSIADLAAGNVDVVLADGGYIKPIASSDGSGLEVVGPALSIGGGIGVGLRKEDTDLKAKFDAVIKSMKDDGSLNEMIKTWFDDPILF